jgi:hypothetical protein
MSKIKLPTFRTKRPESSFPHESCLKGIDSLTTQSIPLGSLNNELTHLCIWLRIRREIPKYKGLFAVLHTAEYRLWAMLHTA